MGRKTKQEAAPSLEDHFSDLFYSWRHNFVSFFEVGLNLVLSNQQKELVQTAQGMVWAKIKAGKGKKLTKREKELASKLGISVHSGKGLGKDFTVAGLIICVIYLFEPFKGICTATSSKQLEDVLSAEVKKLLKKAHPAIRESFIVDKGGIYKIGDDGKKSNNFMSKRTANVKGRAEENADTLQGYHEDYMLLVGDEASGIPDAVFSPIETTLTGLCNFAILIGNVMRANGYFYQTHYGKNDRKLWLRLRWDAEESDLEDIKPGLKAQIARVESKYGRDSNAFRMNVQGLPPAVEKDALIPWDWIVSAQDRFDEMIVDPETDPTILGVDVGAGGDDSAIDRRVGGKHLSNKTKSTTDTTVLADWLNEKIDFFEPDQTIIDSNGMGASFCHFFRKFYAQPLYELNVGKGTTLKGEYGCLRDEIWIDRVRPEFEHGRIAIDPADEELALELSALKVIDWYAKPLRVMSKKQMKSLGLRSPNKADALMHTYVFSGTGAAQRYKQIRDKYNQTETVQPEEHSWMVV